MILLSNDISPKQQAFQRHFLTFVKDFFNISVFLAFIFFPAKMSRQTTKNRANKNIVRLFGLIGVLILSICCTKTAQPTYNVVIIVSDACRKDIGGNAES